MTMLGIGKKAFGSAAEGKTPYREAVSLSINDKDLGQPDIHTAKIGGSSPFAPFLGRGIEIPAIALGLKGKEIEYGARPNGAPFQVDAAELREAQKAKPAARTLHS